MPEFQRQPQVRIADVREYVSANGKQYFTYYAGRAKYLLFRDDNAVCTGNEVARWALYVEEAPERSTAAKPAAYSKPAPQRGPRGSSPDARANRALRERGLHPDGAVVDDVDLGF